MNTNNIKFTGEVPTLFGRPLPFALLILCSITMAFKVFIGIYTIMSMAASILILLGCFVNMLAVLGQVLSILRKSVSWLKWSMLFSFIAMSTEVGLDAAVIMATSSSKFNTDILSACKKLIVNNNPYRWLFLIQNTYYDSKYYTDVKNGSASSTSWCTELPGKLSSALLMGVAISFLSILVQIVAVWKAKDYISFLNAQAKMGKRRDSSFLKL